LDPANGLKDWIGNHPIHLQQAASGHIYYTIDGTTPINSTGPGKSLLWQDGEIVP